MTLNGLRRALLASTLVSAVAVAPVLAAPDWLPAEDLSAVGGNALLPQVAIDGNDTATAVWRRLNAEGRAVVETSSRPGGGSWTLLATPLSGLDADTPEVAVNGAGAAVAVWTERVSVGSAATDAVVMARRRAPGSTTWSPAVALSTTDVDEGVPGADPGEASGPEVAIDPAGNAVVTWWRHDGTDNVIEASESPAGTAAWTPADEISNSDGDEAGSDLGEAFASQVAMDAAGTAYAVWLRSNGATFTVEASRLPLSGGWSNPPQVISPVGSDAATPQIAVTPAGDATVVWQLVGAPSLIQSSFLPAGGVDWSAPEDLTFETNASDPQIGVDAEGNAVAVWSQEQVVGNALIRSASRTSSLLGTWSTPVALSEDGADAFLPQLAVGSAGAVAAWSRSDGANEIVQTAYRLGAGAWITPTNRSAAGQDAEGQQVAIDRSGNAVAVWSRPNGLVPANTVVQAARFDATNPAVSAVHVPATAETGSLVQMSIVATDAWSSLAVPAWTFDDGTEGTGQIVNHAYAAPGIYTVTVTQMDAVGHATSQQRQITVTEAAVPPAPGVTLSKVSALCAKRPKATCQPRITLTLNRPATVTLIVKRPNGTVVGRIVRSGRQGVNRIGIPARVGTAKLRPGRYRISVRATSDSATSVTLTTKIVTVR